MGVVKKSTTSRLSRRPTGRSKRPIAPPLHQPTRPGYNINVPRIGFVEWVDTTMNAAANITLLSFGSYGLVFKIVKGDASEVDVVKAIPISRDKETPLPSIPEDTMENARSEVLILRRVMGLQGFVRIKDAFITNGLMPDQLQQAIQQFLQARHEKSRTQAERNEHKTCKSHLKQLSGAVEWLLIIMDYAGEPMPRHLFWEDACSVLEQVTKALALAEQYEFEHRDLHFGNVCLSWTTKAGACRWPIATIIDLGLSRCTMGSGEVRFNDLQETSFSEFPAHEKMAKEIQKHHNGDWSRFAPFTNVIFLEAFARYLSKITVKEGTYLVGQNALAYFIQRCATGCEGASSLAGVFEEHRDWKTEQKSTHDLVYGVQTGGRSVIIMEKVDTNEA